MGYMKGGGGEGGKVGRWEGGKEGGKGGRWEGGRWGGVLSFLGFYGGGLHGEGLGWGWGWMEMEGDLQVEMSPVLSCCCGGWVGWRVIGMESDGAGSPG